MAPFFLKGFSEGATTGGAVAKSQNRKKITNRPGLKSQGTRGLEKVAADETDPWRESFNYKQGEDKSARPLPIWKRRGKSENSRGLRRIGKRDVHVLERTSASVDLKENHGTLRCSLSMQGDPSATELEIRIVRGLYGVAAHSQKESSCSSDRQPERLGVLI